MIPELRVGQVVEFDTIDHDAQFVIADVNPSGDVTLQIIRRTEILIPAHVAKSALRVVREPVAGCSCQQKS